MIGWKQWFLVGCYISLGGAADTDHITKELCHFPDGLGKILVGDTNVKISQSEGKESNEDLAVMMVVE